MTIGIIFTGGTIGSRVGDDGYISVFDENAEISDATNYRLLSMYIERFGNKQNVNFITRQPYNILSENLEFNNVKKLVECLNEMPEGLDGIIITHGTDSLQYTAGYLYYLREEIEIRIEKKIKNKKENKYPWLSVPTILVSSAYVLDDERANGLANFELAVDYISNFSQCKTRLCENRLAKQQLFGKLWPGVFVAYKNEDGGEYIHAGNKLAGLVPFSADVYSIRNEFWAKREKGEFIFNEESSLDESELVLKLAGNSASNCIYDSSAEGQFVDSSTDIQPDSLAEFKLKNVLRLAACPDMFFPDLDGADLILLESYHSGTICVSDELKKFVANALASNIKVYLTGISSKVSQYETVKEYEKIGIIPIYDEAPVAAYCRLSLGL